MQHSQGERQHLLTITLEDYFHAPAFRKLIDRKRWGLFESRFEENCKSVLDRLDQAGSSATFFVNAWVAQTRADVVQEVVRRGHEIALAGHRGQSFRSLSAGVLRQQLRKDKEAVQKASGREVKGFRLSDVLLGPQNLWALRILAEEGFCYDSSLSPFLFAFASQPYRRFVHREQFGSDSIWEFPLSSQRIAGLMVPVAGGNYFRQYPEWFSRAALKHWHLHVPHPLVLYFRLWDFDPKQPHIETNSAIRTIRHYRNSRRMVETLNEVLTRYRFGSIANHLQLPPKSVLAGTQSAHPANLPTECEARAQKRVPVSVIVPCYNEAAAIPYLSNALLDLKAGLRDAYDVHFVLVDDGSKDETWEAIRRHFSNREDTTLIRHELNRGVSAAIRSGLEVSHEIACSMDCDCSYDPHELKPMLQMLGEGVDLVTASPYHPAGSVLHVPAWRLALSRTASSLYALVTGRELYTFTACLRVYRRSNVLAVRLKRSGFLGVAELIGVLILQGNGVVEHPATLECRIFGRSKMKIARTILGHLGLLSEFAWVRLSRGGRAERGLIPKSPHPNAEEIPSGVKL